MDNAMRKSPSCADNDGRRRRKGSNASLKSFALALCLFVLTAPARADIRADVAQLGAAFESRTINANGSTIHFVVGGKGPALILLHGFPQDWRAFRTIMPRLTQSYTVVAVDLRGIGGSSPSAGSFDAASMAEDVRRVVEELQSGPVFLVGHDIGALVAYATARKYPATVRGVMLLDTPVPGTDTWATMRSSSHSWHMDFLQTPGLAEELLPGREAIFFRRALFDRAMSNRAALSEADIARYAQSYAAPAQLNAALQIYRAFDSNEAFSASRRDELNTPLILVGGDKGFGPLISVLANDLRGFGWKKIASELVPASGHYLLDESPEAVAALIEKHARVSFK